MAIGRSDAVGNLCEGGRKEGGRERGKEGGREGERERGREGEMKTVIYITAVELPSIQSSTMCDVYIDTLHMTLSTAMSAKGSVLTWWCHCSLLIAGPSPRQQGQALAAQVEGQRLEN